MKNLKNLMVILLAFMIVLQSCEKDELISTEYEYSKEIINTEKNSQKTVYFVDNVMSDERFAEKSFDSNKFPFIIQTDSLSKETGELVVLMYFYTNEEDYIQYGEKNKINLKKQQLFVKLMKEYANNNNSCSYFENNKSFSQEYKNYEETLYNKIFNPDFSKSFSYSMCAGLNGTGNSMFLQSVWSYIPIVNNDIESTVCKFGWRYTVTYFDNPGYLGPIYTIHGSKNLSTDKIVNTDYSFWNKASSVINVL